MIEITKKSLEGMTFIDLFAGLGGFRLALESLGAKCVYSKSGMSQYKRFMQKTSKIYLKVILHRWMKRLFLIMIFCVQDFRVRHFQSVGKQRGFEDSRGTLFFDVARIVKEKKPKIVFMENVKNFATHDNGHTLEVVKGTMEELGYTFYQRVLNAVDYGVPQKRERIYMVCFRNDLDIKDFSYPKPFALTRHVEDFLLEDESLVEDLYVSRPDTYMNGVEDTEYSEKSIRLGIVNKGGQGERIYSTKGIAITLSAYGGGIFAKTGGYLINGKTRKLHPRECARIMGYPDSYKICSSANQAYKQFGNSVVIDVLQLIGIEIGEALERRQ